MGLAKRHNVPGREPDTDLQGVTCLVTGATSGIGEQTALGLARLGATVLVVARNPDRGVEVARAIRAAAPQAGVDLFVADLAVQRDVRTLAANVAERHPRLDVLINNAAVVNAEHRSTCDGIEAALAVNHLAPFLLTHLLTTALTAAPAARVITVSSYLHHRVKTIPWDQLNGERGYRSQDAYNLTKLMNILFTYELARRCGDTGVTANALHPGWPLKTNLGREQHGPSGAFDRATKLFAASPARGAKTSLWLAASPAVAGATGGYYAKCRPARSSALSHDPRSAQRLWQLSAQLCGITTPT
ncbi:MAG: SDR family NAD(P)-dependent oxidoreductase [Sciscionella sp.]